MRKHLVILGTIVILLTIVLIRYYTHPDEKTDEEKIIGLWERINFHLEQTWQFTQDSNIIISGTDIDINYWFENGYLFTHYPVINYLDKHQYSFEDDDVLTLNLIAGGGAIDPDTGKIVDLENSSIITEFIFHRIS